MNVLLTKFSFSSSQIIWKKVNKTSPITIGEYVFDPDNRYSVTREDPYMDSQMASIDSQRTGYENPRWNLQVGICRLESMLWLWSGRQYKGKE